MLFKHPGLIYSINEFFIEIFNNILILRFQRPICGKKSLTRGLTELGKVVTVSKQKLISACRKLV